MKLTAKEIAQLIDGEIEGNPNVIITHTGKIEDAAEGAITFLANPKYESFIYTTKASIVLVANNFRQRQKINTTLIKVKDVYAALTKILHKYEQSKHPGAGISSSAFIDTTVKMEEGVSVGPFTSIMKNVQIGKRTIIYPQVFIGSKTVIGQNVIIYPGVRIYNNCEIGDNCIIHANTVIGSDGFGYAPGEGGTFRKIPQIGKVIIESEVEIGANTVIDRATIGATLIKKGTKLDNLIQVAHNVSIGSNTVIAAQAGIAGSTQIGNQCQIGGQAGFAGHLQIADGVKVQAQSGVASSIKKEGSKVFGYPAISYQDYLRAYTLFRQLPKLEKRIRLLEEKNK